MPKYLTDGERDRIAFLVGRASAFCRAFQAADGGDLADELAEDLEELRALLLAAPPQNERVAT